MTVTNEPVCYDIGYTIETIDGRDEPVLFALDDEGHEVKRWVGHDGPWICSDQELEARDWAASRGAVVNYLPSWKRHNDEVSSWICRMAYGKD